MSDNSHATTAEESAPEAGLRHSELGLAFPLISLGVLVADLGLGTALVRGWLWLAVPLVLVISHLMHGLLIGFHEASHGLLRKSRRLNDLDGVLMGAFSGLPFSLYRAAHQSHHAQLATERDEELWPFVHPGMPRWSRCLAAFCELTMGIVFTPLLFWRTFLRPGSPIRNKKLRRRIWAEFALSIALWSGILGVVTAFGVWRYFLWMYAAPAYLAANMQSWRKYIEHVGLVGSTINSSTRNIVAPGWLGRLLSFSLLEEPYHGVHHRHAGLPHAALPKYVSVLTPTRPGEMPPYPSYWRALLDMVRTLGNPYAGAQWLPHLDRDGRVFTEFRQKEA